MRILRHESGHAIDNAYRLRRRRRRQQLFGKPSQPYPQHYTPKPYSKSFVLHLERWYAQSHPDEDFAETFAVWLTPKSSWRQRYAGWPALRKLEYVDDLMESSPARRPPVRRAPRRRSAPHAPQDAARALPREALALRARQPREFYDRDSALRLLRRSGVRQPSQARRRSCAARAPSSVARCASSRASYQYTIDQVLEDMIERCRELNLRLTARRPRPCSTSRIVLTVQTMNFLHSGRHRVAL